MLAKLVEIFAISNFCYEKTQTYNRLFVIDTVGYYAVLWYNETNSFSNLNKCFKIK